MKWLLILAIVSIILLSGCTTTGNVPLSSADKVDYIQCVDGTVIKVGESCPVQETELVEPVSEPIIEEKSKLVCENKCEETTHYSEGKDVNGKCEYSVIEENSETCGYNPDVPVLEIVEMACIYQYNSSFLIHLKSVSSIPIPLDSKIKILFDDGNNKSYSITSEYTNGQRLWQDISTDSGWNTFGRNYEFQGINNSSYDKKDQDYAYIYCPPEISKKECNKTNGLILYEGNVIEDCGAGDTRIDDKGYFTPYNNFIEIADKQSNQTNNDVQLLKNINLKKSDFPNTFTVSDTFTGFQTQVKYFSDLNKQLEQELIDGKWKANVAINLAKKERDSKLMLDISVEDIYSSISIFEANSSYPAEKVKEFKINLENRIADKEDEIREYERDGYENVVIEQIDSNNITNGKMFLTSNDVTVTDSDHAKYISISMLFTKGDYLIGIYAYGLGDTLTPEKVDAYAKIISDRIDSN